MNMTTPTNKRPTLLIADDSDSTRALLSAQLAKPFHIVGLAKDAEEAVEFASKHHPAVALIDVDMPNGGAHRAVPEIAQGSPETCIVVLSADEESQTVVELINEGATTYVKKGIPGSELSEILFRSLSAH